MCAKTTELNVKSNTKTWRHRRRRLAIIQLRKNVTNFERMYVCAYIKNTCTTQALANIGATLAPGDVLLLKVSTEKS